MTPTRVFIRLDLKNDPWPQSWNTMKVLTRNPAAGTVSARVSQYEICSDQIIRTHISRYAPKEVITCHQLLRLSGLLYLEMISIHSGFPPFFFTVSIVPVEITDACQRRQTTENQYKDSNIRLTGKRNLQIPYSACISLYINEQPVNFICLIS